MTTDTEPLRLSVQLVLDYVFEQMMLTEWWELEDEESYSFCHPYHPANYLRVALRSIDAN